MKNWLIQLKGFIIWVIVLFIACFSLYCNADQSGDPETVEITFWHSFVASTRDALDELIDNFEDINPQIKINDQYVPTGDARIQKLITAIQSKTAPDISWIHADFLDKLADVKAIYPMRKFIDGPLGLREDELNDIFDKIKRDNLNRFVFPVIENKGVAPRSHPNLINVFADLDFAIHCSG